MNRIANANNHLHYVYIEDETMYHLRYGEIFAYKDMPKEILSLLEDYCRSNLYLLGLRRLLWKLVRGNDFKILTKDGWLSFQGLCKIVDDDNITKNQYRLKGTRINPNTKMKPYPPVSSPFDEFLNNRILPKNQYIKYLGRDTIKQISKRVGNDPHILIHAKTSILTGKHESIGNNYPYNIEFNQEKIIDKMLKGEDFIIAPFGHSCQAFLTELTSLRERVYFDFRLTGQ